MAKSRKAQDEHKRRRRELLQLAERYEPFLRACNQIGNAHRASREYRGGPHRKEVIGAREFKFKVNGEEFGFGAGTAPAHGSAVYTWNDSPTGRGTKLGTVTVPRPTVDAALQAIHDIAMATPGVGDAELGTDLEERSQTLHVAVVVSLEPGFEGSVDAVLDTVQRAMDASVPPYLCCHVAAKPPTDEEVLRHGISAALRERYG